MRFPVSHVDLLPPAPGGARPLLHPGAPPSGAIRIVALVSSAAALAMTVVLFFWYDRAAGGLQFVERVPWIPTLGISYFVGVNGINVILLLLTGVIITAGVLASWDVVHRQKEFFILLLTLTTGCVRRVHVLEPVPLLPLL